MQCCKRDLCSRTQSWTWNISLNSLRLLTQTFFKGRSSTTDRTRETQITAVEQSFHRRRLHWYWQTLRMFSSLICVFQNSLNVNITFGFSCTFDTFLKKIWRVLAVRWRTKPYLCTLKDSPYLKWAKLIFYPNQESDLQGKLVHPWTVLKIKTALKYYDRFNNFVQWLSTIYHLCQEWILQKHAQVTLHPKSKERKKKLYFTKSNFLYSDIFTLGKKLI